MRHVLPATLVLALALTGCAAAAAKGNARPPGMNADAQTPREVPMTIVALPGKLDAMPVFNSNSPEIVTEAGITLSTLPARTEAERAAYHDVAFEGPFAVFSHHIAKDATPGARLLRLGLVAHNPGAKPVTVRLLEGATWLSQPDALYKPLDAIIPDPEGTVYAGPGDRIATDLLHGRSPMKPQRWTVPARGATLLYDLPIPTDVAIPPPINGRTAYARYTSSGPIHLSEAAVFAAKDAAGGFKPTTLADFQAAIAAKTLAGPRDLAAVPFDVNGPVPRGFRYGRVAGVTAGDRWEADLTALVAGLEPGKRLGVPIASVYLNKLGTGQVQSAEMRTRYADTAYQAHGNYGVTYELAFTLTNPDAKPRIYALALTHPARVVGDRPGRAAVFMDPPGKLVSYRGPMRLREAGRPDRFVHVALRQGEELPPFDTISVAPGETRNLTLSLHYTSDATPPQLLTITRTP